jgi:hypothetical protein
VFEALGIYLIFFCYSPSLFSCPGLALIEWVERDVKYVLTAIKETEQISRWM